MFKILATGIIGTLITETDEAVCLSVPMGLNENDTPEWYFKNKVKEVTEKKATPVVPAPKKAVQKKVPVKKAVPAAIAKKTAAPVKKAVAAMVSEKPIEDLTPGK